VNDLKRFLLLVCIGGLIYGDLTAYRRIKALEDRPEVSQLGGEVAAHEQRLDNIGDELDSFGRFQVRQQDWDVKALARYEGLRNRIESLEENPWQVVPQRQPVVAPKPKATAK